MRWRRVILWPLVAAAVGCTGSRWAREDPDYAAKYSHHTDNVARMAKQAVDARHVVGKRGVYGGFAGSDEPFGAGVEGGLFVYPRSWLELRVGGAGLAHDGEHPLSGGGIIGARVQAPSRLAPFAGLGGYAGWAGMRSADNDGIDNNHDGIIDEFGEDEVDGVVALVPELGVHYWITPRVRLTGTADYRLVSEGRGNDSLFYGLSLAVLSGGQRSPPKSYDVSATDGWSFATTGATVEPRDAGVEEDLMLGDQPVELPPLPAMGENVNRVE
jgi:hypothetical protein